MEFEIRHIVPADFPTIVDDLCEMEGIPEEAREMALSVLRWWFFENPWGDGVYAGAFSGSRLAGVASLTPKRFVIHKTDVMAAEIGRTMTHPDFRGRGVFSHLVKHLVQVAKTQDYEVIFGTPNAASGRIYLGRLNFTEVFKFKRFARPANWTALGARGGRIGEWAASTVGFVYDRAFPLRLGGYQHTLRCDVDPALEGFLERACEPHDCYLKRTNEYVAWRLARPGREYHQVYLHNPSGGLVGWAAVTYLTDDGASRAQIGDLWTDPTDSKASHALLGVVMKEARERGVDRVCGMSRAAPAKVPARWRGFRQRSSTEPMIAYAPSGFDIGRLDGWEYRQSDADMY